MERFMTDNKPLIRSITHISELLQLAMVVYVIAQSQRVPGNPLHKCDMDRPTHPDGLDFT